MPQRIRAISRGNLGLAGRLDPQLAQLGSLARAKDWRGTESVAINRPRFTADTWQSFGCA